MDTKSIAWVAGLLEGEGCFCLRSHGHNPFIALSMCDLDIVIRVAKILGGHKVIKCKADTRGGKRLFRLNVYGRRAVEWMMTMYPLMGERRQSKIRECLHDWKEYHVNYTERRPYSRGAEVVWLRRA